MTAAAVLQLSERSTSALDLTIPFGRCSAEAKSTLVPPRLTLVFISR